MADHTEFLDMAREIIAEEGRQVTFMKLSKTPSDASKPWRGPGAPAVTQSVSLFAVFLPDGSGFGKMIEDNDLFKTSDEMLLVYPPATGEDLSQFNLVVDGSIATTDGAKKINVIKELRPADLTVLYAMGVSR